LNSRWAAPLFLLMAGLFMLGPHAAHTGLHVDDHTFHQMFARADWPAIKHEFLRYVPGRNLHVLFYAGLYKAFGPAPDGLHLFGLFLDLLNGLLAWALLGQLAVPARWRLLAAALFLVYPNHGETHFWTVLVVQVLIPVSLTLGAFLAAGAQASPGPRLLAAFLLYAAAVFTYDQVFFMWVPLLLHAATAKRPAPKPALILFALGCLAMNAFHVALRIYAPTASGGRPVIRFTGILRNAAHALFDMGYPLKKLPAWEALAGWGLGPWGVVGSCVVLALMLSALLARLDDGGERRWKGRAFVVGALWVLCGYMPNLFWYVSPRHNYLPSLGLALIASAAVSRMRLGRAYWGAALAALGFGLAASSTFAEGYGWRRSADTLEAFRRAAPKLTRPDTDNLFLLGAPRRVLRAPAFEHPQEAVFLLAQALGRPPVDVGDLSLSPGRTGAFWSNQVELFGPETLRWRSYSGMTLLAFIRGRLTCARALKATRPDGGAVELAVNGRPGCEAVPAVEAPIWLVESRPARPKGEALCVTAGGAELFELTFHETPGQLELSTVWRAQKPLTDFAVAARLLDGSGKAVYEPIYRIEGEGHNGRRALWPLYDDVLPASRWKPGAGARQKFQARLDRPLPGGRLDAELTVFEKRPDLWAKTGVCRAAARRE
jgi:hypothetical protein